MARRKYSQREAARLARRVRELETRWRDTVCSSWPGRRIYKGLFSSDMVTAIRTADTLGFTTVVRIDEGASLRFHAVERAR